MLDYLVLKNKNYKNFWYAQAISQFGGAFYYWVFLYMVDYLTQSPVMLAYMGMAESLPFLIVSPYAGVIADQFDRKKIMILTDYASTSILIILGISTLIYGEPPLTLLYITAFALSSIAAFFTPAKNAAVPQIVNEKLLTEANALNLATQNFMPIIGIGLSGSALVVVQKLFPALFFPGAIFLNGLTFLGSAYFLSKLPSLIPVHKNLKKETATKKYLEGFTFIIRHKVLRSAFILECIVFFSVGSFTMLYVTANRIWFGGKFITLAFLELSFAVVMVSTSLYVGRKSFKKPAPPYLFGVLGMGVVIGMLGFSHSYWIFASFNALAGVFLPYMQIPLMNYIQLTTPNQYLGRVNSTLTMMTWGIMPLGMGIGSRIASVVGIGGTFISLGSMLLLNGFIGLFNRPFLRADMPVKLAEEKK